MEATKPTSDAALVAGVRIVLQSSKGIDPYGVERVDASGQRFDPKLHDAVSTVSVQDHALVGTVVSQSAPGYRFGDRALRAAKVSVGVQSTLVPASAPSRAVPVTVEPAIFARLRRG